MNRNRRNRETNNLTAQNMALYISGAIAILLLTLSVTLTVSSIRANTDYSNALQESQSLQKKRRSLKPQVSVITTGKFDLQGKEKQLFKTYSTLCKALFGNARSASAVLEAQDSYIRYFGSSGWNDLKDIAFSSSKKMIASSNSESQVTFSDFDLQTQTIKVVVYTNFDVNKNANVGDALYGLAYVTTTYNFKTGKASDTNIQSALPTLDDIN